MLSGIQGGVWFAESAAGYRGGADSSHTWYIVNKELYAIAKAGRGVIEL